MPNLDQANQAKLDKAANQFDQATIDFINANYGSDAVWFNDPELGPILRAAAKLGLTGTRYNEYIKTHGVDSQGNITIVPVDQSWFGKNSLTIRNKLAEKISDPGTFKAGVKTNLDTYVVPAMQEAGLTLDEASLQRIAEDSYINGWLPTQIKNAVVAQYHYDPAAAAQLALAGKSPGGLTSKTIEDYSATARSYGVALPKDPAMLETFIKNAIGPNGNEQGFNDYMKALAKIQFPWMTKFIDAGGTPETWLTPVATQIGNLLGVSPQTIDWADPKWNGVLSTMDPKTGESIPNDVNKVLTMVKTNPVFDYVHSKSAKDDAFTIGSQIRSMMGFGA